MLQLLVDVVERDAAQHAYFVNDKDLCRQCTGDAVAMLQGHFVGCIGRAPGIPTDRRYAVDRSAGAPPASSNRHRRTASTAQLPKSPCLEREILAGPYPV